MDAIGVYKMKKWYVQMIDNSWKEIKESEIQKFLDYGCKIKSE